MQIRSRAKKQKKKLCSQAFCGTCRLSVSSPREAESSNDSDDLQTVSSIAHAMVQERLDRMIRESKEVRNGDGRRRARQEEMRVVVMVAMEKWSYDPREDFRESMEQMIAVYGIEKTKDLRRLLNYYVSINSQEFRGTILEARIELGGGARTLLDILRETMDGVDRAVRRPSLKERLGLKGLSCCVSTWGLGPTTMSVREDGDGDGDGPPLSPQIEAINVAQSPIRDRPLPLCVVQSPAATGMNLAAALAAERQLRAALDSENGGGVLSPSPETARTVPGTPSRVSLMRLLEETDGWDGEMKRGEDWGGCDSSCCVCMGRKKGAAFIPCGHTFCRVCSREMWLNRGSCPLCNRPILEILDIY